MKVAEQLKNNWMRPHEYHHIVRDVHNQIIDRMDKNIG